MLEWQRLYDDAMSARPWRQLDDDSGIITTKLQRWNKQDGMMTMEWRQRNDDDGMRTTVQQRRRVMANNPKL